MEPGTRAASWLYPLGPVTRTSPPPRLARLTWLSSAHALHAEPTGRGGRLRVVPVVGPRLVGRVVRVAVVGDGDGGRPLEVVVGDDQPAQPPLPGRPVRVAGRERQPFRPAVHDVPVD